MTEHISGPYAWRANKGHLLVMNDTVLCIDKALTKYIAYLFSVFLPRRFCTLQAFLQYSAAHAKMTTPNRKMFALSFSCQKDPMMVFEGVWSAKDVLNTDQVTPIFEISFIHKNNILNRLQYQKSTSNNIFLTWIYLTNMSVAHGFLDIVTLTLKHFLVLSN